MFLFLNRIQDEVHNYAISYHRTIRQKGTLATLLDMAPGIGEVRRKELLRKFGSLKKLKEASLEELETVLSHDVAVKFMDYLKNVWYNRHYSKGGLSWGQEKKILIVCT